MPLKYACIFVLKKSRLLKVKENYSMDVNVFETCELPFW